MLIYELIDILCDLAIYAYYPDKYGKPGKVALNMKNGETNIMEMSPDDFGNRYAYHLIRRLEKLYEQGEISESGTVAWY